MKRNLLLIIVALLILALITVTSFILFSGRQKTNNIPLATERLTFSDETATEAEREAFFKEAAAKAKRGSQVTIQNCLPNPPILLVTPGQNITLKNASNKAHLISVTATHNYRIPANKEVTIKADFGKGLGEYGYRCDNELGVAGVFSVRSKDSL